MRIPNCLILAAGWLAWSLGVGSLQAQKPLYELKFSDGSLANTGSVGGEAKEVPAPGGGSLFSVSKDKESGGWCASFRMAANGQQGPALQLPNSAEKLGFDRSVKDFTVCAWLRWNGPDEHPDPRQMIACKLDHPQKTGWAFSIRDDGTLRFDWVTKVVGSSRASQTAVSHGRWTHVAMTWRGDDTEGGLKFYLDGVDAGIDLAHTGGGPLVSNNEAVFIGTTTENYLPINGDLADLRIYDRALDSGEINGVLKARAK